MRDYLLFRLYGALASWGDIAVGDIRPSYAYPSKSAVIGLVAAALGVERQESEKLEELFKLSFSVRVDAVGMPIEDYHTIQSPSQKALRNARHNSRIDEITAILWNYKPGAIQSRRTYYTDSIYTVALSETNSENVKWDVFKIQCLPDLSAKLREPEFPLYLGRKSCPLGLPLEPQIQPAQNIKEAFAMARFGFADELKGLMEKSEIIRYYTEEKQIKGMKQSRRDQPVNKERWQFADRDEYYFAEQRGR
jgi:CRISPR system Cascade subunit CasD